MSRKILLLIPGLIAAVALSPLLLHKAQSRSNPVAAPVDESTLSKWLTEIRPQPGEDDYDTIPWQISLWDARVLAAREGKPILLWEMDGHPLGCG
ncbi:MAG: hypothetical protein U0798_00625 [Gemmataceae bacterium]